MTLNLKNLLNPKVKISKMGEFQELQPIEGLEISAVSADLYGDGRDDLTLFYFREGANFAAVYTSSKATPFWILDLNSSVFNGNCSSEISLIFGSKSLICLTIDFNLSISL